MPFLVALGVQSADGRVRAQRRSKFRQVNRFVELVDDIVPALPDGRLRVVDYGSGRAYLTFALHDLLTRVHGREVEMLGLDVKADVVAECEELARRLGADGLRFEVGDIARPIFAASTSSSACTPATRRPTRRSTAQSARARA